MNGRLTDVIKHKYHSVDTILIELRKPTDEDRWIVYSNVL